MVNIDFSDYRKKAFSFAKEELKKKEVLEKLVKK